ncbi:MAG: hypothetical protein IJQ65_03290 [Kiritimatiellae bacterium]|nr:hypothetical protein [Kiritimatiellia bacterium]
MSANDKKVFMGVNPNLADKIVENGRIALEAACQGKPGESVLILVDKDPQRVQCAQALEAGAVQLGMKPIIMDLSVYSGLCHDESFIYNDQKYPTDQDELNARILKPAKAAAEASDVVICIRSPGLTLTYANLFGVPHMDDICLTGKGRRMEYQYTNMENWNITTEGVAAIRPRTTWLNEKLASTKVVRITSPAGTDMAVPMVKGTRWYPIHGIVPLYGEVAIVPALGPETKGVLVIDGPTYRGVRPPSETDREPLRFVMEDGRVKEMTGDAEQLARLKKLDVDNDPPGFGLDEVGLVTTDLADNDMYWTNGRFNNGTHSHDTIHIALGKNVNRDGVVHSNLHMDMDIRRPTVSLDGLVVIKDGKFVDSVIDQK